MAGATLAMLQEIEKFKRKWASVSGGGGGSWAEE